jgi:hypothetical protein
MPRFFTLPVLLFVVAPLTAVEAPAPKQSLKDYVVKSAARTAYGVYVGKKKAGWEIDELKLGKRDDKDVAIETTTGYVAVTTDGEKTVLEDSSTVYYELEGDGAVVYAQTRSKEDGTETVRTAVRKGDGMVLTTEVGGRKTERKIPLPKATLDVERRLEAWLKTAKKGESFDNWTTSWDQDKVDVKEVYTFKERKKVTLGGIETEVCVVQTVSQGAKFDAELLIDGKALVSKVGVLEVRMEPEADAKKIDDAVDLMAATNIPVDKDLGRASKVEKLVLEVTGLDDYALPQSHRQKVTAGKESATLEVSRDHRVEKPAPLTDDERKTHLEATVAIQSDHEKMKAQAKEIVGDEKDPIKVAGLLQKWVHDNLKKSYSDNAEDALTVLENKAGDCTEHTLLFVALARAAGLPAREVGGVAFVGGGEKPAFGWHAWAEIHDGEQWVTVDPTWGQVYVDATHIKFSEGSEDRAYLNVAGKLKLKVVKVETKK